MKANIFSLLFLSIIFVNIRGQDNLDKIIHIWGNSLWQVSPITVDHQGNYYLAGEFEDTVFIDSKNNWLINKDSADFFIIKAHADGSVAWTKVISGMGSEFIRDLEVDRDGYIYIAGQFDQTMLIDTAFIDIGKESDFFIAKMDPAGNLVDYRRGNENGEELHFFCFELDGNGEVCLIGETEYGLVFEIPLSTSAPFGNKWNSFVVKLNGDLEARWLLALGDSISPTPSCFRQHALMPDQDNNIFIAGEYSDNEGSGIFLSKVIQDGKLLWLNPFIASGWVNDIYMSELDEVYMIGAGGILFPDTVSGDYFIAKFDKEGVYLWALGLEYSLWSYVVDRNGYTIAIYYHEWGALDGLIIVDPEGHIVYDQPFDQMEIHMLVLDEAGNVYYNGYFLEDVTLNGEELNSENGDNYVFGRINVNGMIGTTSDESISQNVVFHIFPNPVNDLLTVESAQEEIIGIKAISISGQELYRATPEGFRHQIDLSSFQKGVYLITIRSKDFVVTEKIIKQ